MSEWATYKCDYCGKVGGAYDSKFWLHVENVALSEFNLMPPPRLFDGHYCSSAHLLAKLMEHEPTARMYAKEASAKVAGMPE